MLISIKLPWTWTAYLGVHSECGGYDADHRLGLSSLPYQVFKVMKVHGPKATAATWIFIK